MKIISYKQSISGINIAAQRDILWPCHAFNLSIPVKKKRILNIFEETILKLTHVETNDTQKLAELISLNEELVKFVQLRLVELNLLTERYELKDEAKKLLEQWDEEEDEYLSVKVFVDLVSGKILPVVLESEVYEEYIEKKGQVITFLSGSKGKAKPLSARMIFSNNEYKSKVISPDDVLDAIDSFRKLFYRFSATLDNHITLPKFSRNIGSITIQEEAETIYLHCKVIIQEGNSDFLVTDPFGFDFSSVLTQAIISKENDEWMKKLRIKAENFVVQDEVSTENQIDSNIFNIIELKKYKTIERSINNVEYRFNKLKYKPKNSDEKIENMQNSAEYFQKLYILIENILKQVEKDNPSSQKWRDIFASQTSKQNSKVLEKFAIKTGFTLGDYTGLLHLQPERMISFKNGVVSVEVMLALGLSNANENIRHPFYNLAKNVSDFFIFLTLLQEHRKMAAHGNELDYSKIFQIDRYKCEKCNQEFLVDANVTECSNCKASLKEVRQLDIFREKVYRSVKSLYPAFESNTLERKNDFNSKVTVQANQTILQAKIRLDNHFSLFELNRLKENISLYNELLKIETAQENLLKDSNISITSQSSSLQIVLDEILKDKDKNIDVDSTRRAALDKAIEVKFDLEDRLLPKELSLVGRKKLKAIKDGNPASLGASLIWYLALESDSKLRVISAEIPDFITIISKVLGLRGHSDKFSTELLKEVGGVKNLSDLKESVYKIIKKIMEIYDGILG